jgi:hypothetical protein
MVVKLSECKRTIEFEGIVEGVEKTHQAGDNPQKETIIDEIDGDRQIYLFDDGEILKHRQKVKVILKQIYGESRMKSSLTKKDLRILDTEELFKLNEL